MGFRVQCRIFFLVNAILEGSAVTILIFVLDSPCIKGEELFYNVTPFELLIFAALIPDIVYFFLMSALSTLGLDPLAVAYNLTIGWICILIGIGLVLAILFYCGNPTQFLIMLAGALTMLSGILHLINGIRCNNKIPISEKYWPPRRPKRPKPTRAQKKAQALKDKEEKKARKQREKEAKKAAKGKKADKGKKPTDKKGKKGKSDDEKSDDSAKGKKKKKDEKAKRDSSGSSRSSITSLSSLKSLKSF